MKAKCLLHDHIEILEGVKLVISRVFAGNATNFGPKFILDIVIASQLVQAPDYGKT